MQEKIITYNELNISLKDVFEELGYGDTIPCEDVIDSITEVMEKLNEIVQPRYYFEIFEGELSKKSVNINNVGFDIGKIICSQLRESDKFVLFAVTAGSELSDYLEEAQKDDDMIRVYIADSIGSIIAERTADQMEKELADLIFPEGFKHTNRFSPGYCGWNVNEQHKLFSLLPPHICGITLTESSLMLPVKSVSGIIGVGNKVLRKEYKCSLCSYKNCYKKKK